MRWLPSSFTRVRQPLADSREGRADVQETAGQFGSKVFCVGGGSTVATQQELVAATQGVCDLRGGLLDGLA